MSSPLSPNITRLVVREWLASKAAVLDAIQVELVNRLAPVAAEHAAVLIHASIDPDPRESLIDELRTLLFDVGAFFADLNAHAEENDLWEQLWKGADALDTRVQTTLAHLVERRARMRGVEATPPIACDAEGGGA